MIKRHVIRAALASAGLLLGLALGKAQAGPLQPALVAGQEVFTNPPVDISITTFGVHPLSQPTGDLLFTAAATPSPSMTAEASMVPFFFGTSSGQFIYFMEVLGPDGEVPVSVVATGGVSGSKSAGDDVFAGFSAKALWVFESIAGPPIFFQGGIEIGQTTGAVDQSFTDSQDFLLTTNRAYKVTMTVLVGARGASARAFVDPYFSFGPGVGNDYSFNFSAGIGNAPPIPEPSTYLLLGVGLLALRARWGGKVDRAAVVDTQ